MIQLRIKNCSAQSLRRELRLARDCCKSAGAQLVINDYWQLALEESCDFVHLGQSDLDAADMRALRNAGTHVGISTHDEAELERALTLAPTYIALGPIYPTLLKKMPWPPQGLARIAEWKARLGNIPLVAIGGLTPERLPGVLAAGADSAAVVTDILRHPQPEARMRYWLAMSSNGVAA